MTARTGLGLRLRRWAHALRHSPLHPQWHAFRYKERAARDAAAAARGALLDVGCADGHLRRRLGGSVGYTGLDFPGTATDLYGTRPGVFGDAQRLPFADGTFDCVFSACVFHHIDAAEHVGLLAELRRVLRPGGLITIFEHNPLNPLTVRAVNTCPFDENAVLMRAATLRDRFAQAGFAHPRVRFRIFFPRALRALRPLEPWLAWLPLGAQYSVCAVR